MPTPSSAYGYAPIARAENSTVVARYTPSPKRAESFQSEAQLEATFIAQLERQAYERLHITSESELIANLRAQLEKLNAITFTDTEWHSFYTSVIANPNEGIIEKTEKIQSGGHIQVLHREDGSTKNILLIDKKHIHANSLQVLNQYETRGAHSNRYDVTILVNGLPLVHIELKRRGRSIEEAFNQIERYQRDSFWAGSGLYQYVQIFVISNGTHTKYYSNTTRAGIVAEHRASSRKRTTSNSFAFTIWWADGENHVIADLMDFAKTFFAKHSLLNILTKYCVFNTQKILMVMRPYQIVAAERIINRIETSSNRKTWGKPEAGGYIWHTTGSGKTLTSFKTAQLATELDGLDKVLFVVDRKDLDYQTIAEYNRFQEGAVSGNDSTAMLTRQLEDPTKKIVVTTIQKLSNFVKKYKQHEVYSQHIVIIFDECHRSQFGEMNDAIRRSFRKYHMFGFTGTPIFAQNAGNSGHYDMRTTEQVFGDKLHTYTIVDAITDRNVLPFLVDYVNTIGTSPTAKDAEVAAIAPESALLHPQRIRMISQYILEHFDRKTKRTSVYDHGGIKKRGFNSILATESITAAKLYYSAFKELQQELTPDKRLKIAIIYSYNPNETSVAESLLAGLLREEGMDPGALDQASYDFLAEAIADYNGLFGGSESLDGEGFQKYYKDVSKRMKERELDLLIVVNMFLTGFDATTLNTLWVDKNLKQHGLIQAYSRTNRILNDVKTYGNIVTFRNLEKETNEALTLFGNKAASGIVILKSYEEYYAQYAEHVQELRERFTAGEMIADEGEQKAFVVLWGKILRLVNVLESFAEFGDGVLISAREQQDYQSEYIRLYEEARKRSQAEKESIADAVVFEIELVKQVEVNVSYILQLVAKRLEEHGTLEDKVIEADIARAIDSSPTLRSKKDLILEFLARVNVGDNVEHEWKAFLRQRLHGELDEIISEERLKADATRALVATLFQDHADVPREGTTVGQLLPPASRFTHDNARAKQWARVVEKLQAFIERFRALGWE